MKNLLPAKHIYKLTAAVIAFVFITDTITTPAYPLTDTLRPISAKLARPAPKTDILNPVSMISEVESPRTYSIGSDFNVIADVLVEAGEIAERLKAEDISIEEAAGKLVKAYRDTSRSISNIRINTNQSSEVNVLLGRILNIVWMFSAYEPDEILKYAAIAGALLYTVASENIKQVINVSREGKIQPKENDFKDLIAGLLAVSEQNKITVQTKLNPGDMIYFPESGFTFERLGMVAAHGFIEYANNRACNLKGKFFKEHLAKGGYYRLKPRASSAGANHAPYVKSVIKMILVTAVIAALMNSRTALAAHITVGVYASIFGWLLWVKHRIKNKGPHTLLEKITHSFYTWDKSKKARLSQISKIGRIKILVSVCIAFTAAFSWLTALWFIITFSRNYSGDQISKRIQSGKWDLRYIRPTKLANSLFFTGIALPYIYSVKGVFEFWFSENMLSEILFVGTLGGVYALSQRLLRDYPIKDAILQALGNAYISTGVATAIFGAKSTVFTTRMLYLLARKTVLEFIALLTDIKKQIQKLREESSDSGTITASAGNGSNTAAFVEEEFSNKTSKTSSAGENADYPVLLADIEKNLLEDARQIKDRFNKREFNIRLLARPINRKQPQINKTIATAA
jgi:hypothetical protein